MSVARGYSRDGKKGREQIEYGILTDAEGRPVAVRVFAGATADPTAFTQIITVIRERFGLEELVLVGDRGMITSARISALRELNDDTATGFGWITALRAPVIAKLAADDGPLQMSLFDRQDLAEIAHPDYPDERLIACRNPALADQRARKRNELLAATEKLLRPIADRVARGTLTGAAHIGQAVGKVIDKYKVGKHFERRITDTSLTIARKHDQIATEAALDGIYVLRTSVPAHTLTPAAVVAGYNNLANVERDFRIIKADDLDLRPIHHRLDDRVKAHVLICMLACYLVWHLRKAWTPMTFTDQHPPQRNNPVAPAQRSTHADTKAARKHDPAGNPLRSPERHVHHPRPCRAIREIGHPQPVGGGRGEDTVDEIRCPLGLLVLNGRLGRATVTGTLPAVGPHQTLNGASSNVHAVPTQLDPYLATAQGLVQRVALAEFLDRGGDRFITKLLLARCFPDPLVVGGRADLDAMLGEHGAHGLDSPNQPSPTIGAGRLVILVLGDEPNYRLAGRSSSAPKKIAAALRISLALRNSAFSRLRRLSSSDCSLLTPGGCPASTSARRTHVRTVSGVPTPSLSATAQIAAHCDPYCGAISATIRTARSRSSSGYLLARAMIHILPTQGASGHAGRSHCPRSCTNTTWSPSRDINSRLLKP